MIQRLLLSGIVLAAIILGYPYLSGWLAQDQGLTGTGPVSAGPSSLIVRDVRIDDRDGRLVYHGDVDLRPELARIERGERDAHPNDGAVFQNREGRLPRQERGYYREYVVRTPGIGHAGPQRLIVGARGEIYYTPDHYRSFRRIQ
jgi:ribonuclease T1